MECVNRYENYPLGIVILSSIVPLGIYASGFFIIKCDFIN